MKFGIFKDNIGLHVWSTSFTLSYGRQYSTSLDFKHLQQGLYGAVLKHYVSV